MPATVAASPCCRRVFVWLCGVVVLSPTHRLPGSACCHYCVREQFVTDSAGTALGFIAHYEAVTPASCAASTTATADGTLFGVYAPRPANSTLPMSLVPVYEQSAQCLWLMQFNRPAGVAPRHVTPAVPVTVACFALPRVNYCHMVVKRAVRAPACSPACMPRTPCPRV